MYPFFNPILRPSPSTAKGPAIAPTKRHTESPAVTPGAYPPGKQMNGSNRKSSSKIIIILSVLGGLLLV